MPEEPRKPTERLEETASLPPGSQERFNGWGVMGLPFRSGHVLAMRRFPASSVGPGYNSVWHRTPAGDWVFYATVSPRQSCARFFGARLGDFWIPQRGILAMGQSYFDPFDPVLHSSKFANRTGKRSG